MAPPCFHGGAIFIHLLPKLSRQFQLFLGRKLLVKFLCISLVHEISGGRCVLAGDAVQIPRNEFLAQEEGRILPFRQTVIADAVVGCIGKAAFAVEVNVSFKAHGPCAQLRGLLQRVV